MRWDRQSIILVGLVSGGLGATCEDSVNVFTNVRYHLDFIQEETNRDFGGNPVCSYYNNCIYNQYAY